MNINIEIDDALINDAMRRTGATLKETVEQGLRELIRRYICRQFMPDRPKKQPVSKTYELDENLVRELVEASGISDARTAVEEAMRQIVRLEAQEALADLFGKIPIGNDYKAMRRGRNG